MNRTKSRAATSFVRPDKAALEAAREKRLQDVIAGRDQAVAFEYMLDRLQSLNLIAWIREPGAIHITASSEAGELIQ